MIKKNFLVFGSMAVMGLAFMSCSKDLYSEDAVNELQDATYAANFEKRYGKIDPNQTWDFTTGGCRCRFPPCGKSDDYPASNQCMGV